MCIGHRKCRRIGIDRRVVVFKQTIIDGKIRPTIHGSFIVDKLAIIQFDRITNSNCFEAMAKLTIGVWVVSQRSIIGEWLKRIGNIKTVCIQHATLCTGANKTLPGSLIGGIIHGAYFNGLCVGSYTIQSASRFNVNIT